MLPAPRLTLARRPAPRETEPAAPTRPARSRAAREEQTMAGRKEKRARAPGSRSPRSSPSRPKLDRLDGLHVVREALRARRRTLHRLLVAPTRGGAAPASELQGVLDLAEDAGVPISWVPAEELRQDRPGDAPGNPQHVLLEAGPLPELGLRALLEQTQAARGRRRLLMLDGVEDPQNLGAIARVAEASGVSGLVLSRRHAPPLSPAASRASAGALEWLPVARVGNLSQALKALKQDGFWALAATAASSEASESLFEVESRVLQGDLVVVLGAEGRGVRPGVTAAVDHQLRIPLSGNVASLNVATAGAVIMFELVRRASQRAGQQEPGADRPDLPEQQP